MNVRSCVFTAQIYTKERPTTTTSTTSVTEDMQTKEETTGKPSTLSDDSGGSSMENIGSLFIYIIYINILS